MLMADIHRRFKLECETHMLYHVIACKSEGWESGQACILGLGGRPLNGVSLSQRPFQPTS